MKNDAAVALVERLKVQFERQRATHLTGQSNGAFEGLMGCLCFDSVEQDGDMLRNDSLGYRIIFMYHLFGVKLEVVVGS